MTTMSQVETYTDVVELCTLLQCLGFSVKSMDMSDANISQDGGMQTVVINCQSSGLHVVLEHPSLSCSCPITTNQQNSGLWQVSGVAGGKQLDKVMLENIKEFGCSLLGSLPKSHRDRLTKDLQEIISGLNHRNASDAEVLKEVVNNKSASLTELTTPEKLLPHVKIDTPTRYRSLDTLTSAKNDGTDHQLPAPGRLQRPSVLIANDDFKEKKSMCSRQSTYTIDTTQGSSRRRNKTSSPIRATHSPILESLIAAEKTAEELRARLAEVVMEVMDEDKHDSSISSLALDVSKISLLKCAETSKVQFASSPNLSGIGVSKELTKSSLKRFESISTSQLGPDKSVKDNKVSKLRRFSPNLFKSKNEMNLKTGTSTKNSAKSKLVTGLYKPKIVTPVSSPRTKIEDSPNLSTSSKNKYSHIKSSIPRLSKKE